jgi:hypothetical protein
LRNMTSLRNLKLPTLKDIYVLDGCTFKLDSFECHYVIDHNGFFRTFLSSQPSLKYVKFPIDIVSSPLEATCLPNLTRINAGLSWLPYLIPGRPLNEVITFASTSDEDSIDWSIFALSTTPIQRLAIDYFQLSSIPTHLLTSFRPSLTHFTLKCSSCYTVFKDEGVCGLPLY